MSRRHTVTLERRLERDRPTFNGRCSCGDQSGPLPTSGMVAGWTGRHQDIVERRLPAFIDAPERGTYEAAMVRRNPRLVPLLVGGPDGFRRGEL